MIDLVKIFEELMPILHVCPRVSMDCPSGCAHGVPHEHRIGCDSHCYHLHSDVHCHETKSIVIDGIQISSDQIISRIKLLQSVEKGMERHLRIEEDFIGALKCIAENVPYAPEMQFKAKQVLRKYGLEW